MYRRSIRPPRSLVKTPCQASHAGLASTDTPDRPAKRAKTEHPAERGAGPSTQLLSAFGHLRDRLEAAADPVAAVPMKKYMKDKFDMHGIKSPARRNLYKDFIRETNFKLATEDELLQWVDLLWAEPFRDYQYLAMDQLADSRGLLTARGAAAVERLVERGSWWDTVDFLAANILGTFYKTRMDDLEDKILNSWSQSDNMWLNRTGILVQLKYKNATREDLLDAAIKPHASSVEFFHQKAIGWALREFSKTNPAWVKRYIAENALKPLSVREALRRM